MRILYHHRTQGAEPESVHIAAIADALRRLGHEVDILGPSRLGADDRAARPSLLARIKRRMPRPFVELAQIAYNAVSLAQVLRALARRRYDFVYERYALYNIAGVLAARAFGKPIVLEVNTLYAQAWAKYFGLRFPRLARALERHTFRNADAIVTVSAALRASLEQEGVKSSAITVLPNAIDPEEFDPARHGATDLRRKLGLPRVVAGFVGTMNQWQGVEGYGEVVQRVVTASEDVGFLFVGDGPCRATLEAELERRGVRRAVVFTCRKTHAEIPEFLAAMDIGLLLDSNAYGSPMKIFEYWAMGKAVVAAAVPPVLEVLRDGETGFLIAPGSAAEMADRILRLARDPQMRARIADAGRQHVLRAHTWDRNAARILDSLAARQLQRPGRVGQSAP